jgi:rRNA-processing protein FCF1
MSASCRRCRDAILDICHKVAVSPAMLEEWKRHMSRFARKWLRSMAAHRKPPQSVEPTDVPINLSDYTNSARAQIEKDLCLLEAALGAEKIIVTRDDSLKKALAQRPDGKALLKSIKWVNPLADGVKALESL